eukprot:1143094-Heterocapsa_arctica.AAC.1
MEGIGSQSGDTYHAWVKIEELLKTEGPEGLLPACREPLQEFLFPAAPTMFKAGNSQVGPLASVKQLSSSTHDTRIQGLSTE